MCIVFFHRQGIGLYVDHFIATRAVSQQRMCGEQFVVDVLLYSFPFFTPFLANAHRLMFPVFLSSLSFLLWAATYSYRILPVITFYPKHIRQVSISTRGPAHSSVTVQNRRWHLNQINNFLPRLNHGKCLISTLFDLRKGT